jgi:hypothetical protein
MGLMREVKTGEMAPIDMRSFIGRPVIVDVTNLKEKRGEHVPGVLAAIDIRGAILVRSFSLREWFVIREWKVIKTARSHM